MGNDDSLYYTTDSNDSRSDGGDNDDGSTITMMTVVPTVVSMITMMMVAPTITMMMVVPMVVLMIMMMTVVLVPMMVMETVRQLIQNNSNEIDRVITRGNIILRIGDWIIRSSKSNARGGSTLLHSNYGGFQVTLIGHHYRFDGFLV